MAKRHSRPRWLGWLAVIAAASLVMAWSLADRSDPPRGSVQLAPSTDAEVAREDAGAPLVAPAPSPPPRPPSPPVSASAPPGCPDDEPDDAHFVRPSVWDALRVRTDELRDRLPRLSRDASPGLRAGLNGITEPDADRAVDQLISAPDRVRDGFDVAVAALFHAAMRALAEDDLRVAARRARSAVREAPDDPLAHAVASLASERAHETALARDEIEQAYALAPDEPALALAAARAEAEAAHFDRALGATDAYLRMIPEDARIRRWRDRLALREELTRGHARRSVAGIEIAWAPDALPSARVDAVLEVVRQTLDEVARLTARARRSELAVVVYADRDAMRRATCTPSWTGAVFDGVLHLDAATLSRSDASWERVVRHESTHAQMARIEGRIPHWLNEGFAQWMEGTPSNAARHAWRRMVRDRFWIPFESLEGGLLVIDDPSDAGLAYHQSLAMMLYLVERRGSRVIRDAVAQIEAGRHEGLLARLVPGTGGEQLLAFLAAREAP